MTIIAMAADEVTMHEGSMFMVHRAWTFAMGNALELGKTVSFLNKMDAGIVDLYESRTGRPRDELQKLVDDETWMTAHEAVAEKFAHGVIPADGAKTSKAKAAVRNALPIAAPQAADRRAVIAKIERAKSLRNQVPSALKTYQR
jgi:hypothetical protein